MLMLGNNAVKRINCHAIWAQPVFLPRMVVSSLLESDDHGGPTWGKVHIFVFGPLSLFLVSPAVGVWRASWDLLFFSMARTLQLSWLLIALLFLSGLQCEQGKHAHSRNKRDISDAQ